MNKLHIEYEIISLKHHFKQINTNINECKNTTKEKDDLTGFVSKIYH